jgi:hypothetical protein
MILKTLFAEIMPENCLSFDGFREACESAQCYYPRPYGIYHKGEVYWHKKLPRRKGSVVRYFEDNSGPCKSLIVLTLDGKYLCNAYPPAWYENDLAWDREFRAYWESLTEEERAAILADD